MFSWFTLQSTTWRLISDSISPLNIVKVHKQFAEYFHPDCSYSQIVDFSDTTVLGMNELDY